MPVNKDNACGDGARDKAWFGCGVPFVCVGTKAGGNPADCKSVLIRIIRGSCNDVGMFAGVDGCEDIF